MQLRTNTLNLKHIRPDEEQIELTCANDDVQTLYITVFDFTKQLYSLLADPELNQMNNFTVDPKQPFKKYVPLNGKLGEVHLGSWYKMAWEHMKRNTKKFS